MNRMIGFRQMGGGHLSTAPVMTLAPGAVLTVNDNHRHRITLVDRRAKAED